MKPTRVNRQRIREIFFSLLLSVIFQANAMALTRTVATDGSGDYNCDGIHDDVQINEAITDVHQNGGGTVHLKQGVYVVGDQILVRDNITLEGEGDRGSSKTVIKLEEDADWGVVDGNEFFAGAIIQPFAGLAEGGNRNHKNAPAHNVSFRHFEIDGNLSNQHYIGGDGHSYEVEAGTGNYAGIAIGSYDNGKSTNITFSYLTIHDNATDGIFLQNGNGIVVEFLRTYQAGHASVCIVESTNTVVENCDLDIINNSGVRIDTGNHIRIRNNHIYSQNDAGNWGIQLYNRYTSDVMDDVVIEKNVIERLPGAGILLYSDSADITDGVIVRNNMITQCGFPGGEMIDEGAGINIYNFNGTIIENNTLFNNIGGGIFFGVCAEYEDEYEVGSAEYNQIKATLGTPKTAIVRNNIITHSTSLDMTMYSPPSGGYGIYVRDENSRFNKHHLKDNTVVTAEYNNVWGNSDDDYYGCQPGTGSISVNPLYISGNTITNKYDPYPAADLHLQSEDGRWNGSGWEADAESSACINAGDPVTSYADESTPNGGRVNMGVYGNTVEASRGARSLPTADAGSDQTVIDGDNNSIERILLDGSGSHNDNGTIVSYVWTDEQGIVLSTEISPALDFSVGWHTISLTVTDTENGTDEDTVHIEVRRKNDYALNFNSGSTIDESVVINNIPIGSSLTIEMWIKQMATNNDTDALLDFGGDGRRLVLRTGSIPSWGLSNTAYSDTGISLNTWHHLAFVAQSGTLTGIYIDGVSQTVMGSGAITMPEGTFGVAAMYTGIASQLNFKGCIDELRLWDVARTGNEIGTNKDHELTGSEEHLVGYWNFNDGSGNKLTDQAGENDGTLSEGMGPENWVRGAINPITLCGDVSADTHVELNDLILVLHTLAGGTSFVSTIGDCNDDQKIGLEEGIRILQELAGI